MDKKVALSVSVLLAVLAGVFLWIFNEGKVIPSKDSFESVYFGNEVIGDLTYDGKPDKGFLVTKDDGKGGTFFYAVVDIKTDTGYTRTNEFMVGHNIAPQSNEINAGEFHINFAERKSGEPISVQSSQGAVLLLKVSSEGKLEGLMK